MYTYSTGSPGTTAEPAPLIPAPVDAEDPTPAEQGGVVATATQIPAAAWWGLGALGLAFLLFRGRRRRRRRR